MVLKIFKNSLFPSSTINFKLLKRNKRLVHLPFDDMTVLQNRQKSAKNRSIPTKLVLFLIIYVMIDLIFNPFRNNVIHTTQNSQNKWTKILSHETPIFGLKMMVKSGLKNYILKLSKALQSCCCLERLNWPGRLAGIFEGAW